MADDRHVDVSVYGQDGVTTNEMPGLGAGRLDVGERFALGARVGKGGMGEVFTARDERLNRELAIKVLPGNEHAEALAQRFVREAQVTAQLTHPNVVPVYSLEQTSDYLPALTMKLIRGGTFQDYIAECGARPEGAKDHDPQRHGLKARVEHFLKVCDAMAYSHDRGVIHRDIKPDNLMLGTFGEVYVMDWGLARIEGTSDLPPVTTDLHQTGPLETQHGQTLGTLRYMPPEQVEGDQELIGAGSDQFALGMTLFELVTLTSARRPGLPLGKQLNMASEAERETFTSLGLDRVVPPDLQAIVDKATAFAIGDRYDSVQALADDLRRFLRGEETRAYPDSAIRRVWRRLHRHPVQVLATLLVIVVATTGVSITNLTARLAIEREAAADQRRLASLLSLVAHRVQSFDRELSSVEILLEGLAVRTRDLINDDDAPRGPYVTPRDLREGRGPADTGYSERYDQVITKLRPITHIAAGAEAAKPFAERMVGLDPVLKEVALRSLGDDVMAKPAEERAALLDAGVPLFYAYAAFENGVMLSYPGNADYPEDYDARKRPWYTGPRGTHGPRWGELYGDATGTGFLLPCNRALYDDDGVFIGVAGADLSMNRVIEDIDIEGLAGVRESFLLDGEGGIIVRASERGMRSERTVGDNSARAHQPIGVPALMEAIGSGDVTGFTRTDEDLWIFARLEAVPWLLVVQLDPAAHDL